MRKRGQTSMEYLLLTAGVVLVAVVAGQYVISSGKTVGEKIETETNTLVKIVDTTPPSTEILCNGGPCLTKYNTDVKISFFCQDNLGGVGCKKTSWSILKNGVAYSAGSCSQPNGCENIVTLTAPASGSAIYEITFFSIDKNSNTENPKKVAITIGPPGTPTCVFKITPPYPKPSDNVGISVDVYNETVKNATLYIMKGTTIIAKKDCGDLIPGGSCALTFNPLTDGAGSGSYELNIELNGENSIGNPVKCIQTFVVDGVPPTTTILAKFPDKSWYSDDVNIEYHISDPAPSSGVGYATYKIYNGTQTGVETINKDEANILVPIGPSDFCNQEGIAACKLEITGYDNAGNPSTAISVEINVDLTAPISSATCNPSSCTSTSSVTVTLSCSDTLSGCAKIYYCKDSSNSCTPNTEYTGAITISSTGTYYVRFYAVDNAGNAESPPKSVKVVISSSGGGGGGGNTYTDCECLLQVCKGGDQNKPYIGCARAYNGGTACECRSCYICDGCCEGCDTLSLPYNCNSDSECCNTGSCPNSCPYPQVCVARCVVCPGYTKCVGPQCGTVGATC